MTSLADKIRVLSGTEDSMTPSQMTSSVQTANDEVDTQSALIDQLSAMLNGKTSGSSSNVNIETCTVTIKDLLIDMGASGENYLLFISATVMENGEMNAYSLHPDYFNEEFLYEVTINNVVCGTTIAFGSHLSYSSPPYTEVNGTAEFVSSGKISEFESTNSCVFIFKAPMIANEQCYIKYAYEA